ncbi:MAG: shikimate dehydrogenase family protein [Burkholderiales bacterium]
MSRLSGKSHLWALIADPVAHVRAPAFVNPMFERRGLDGFLLPLHVRAADLADVVPRLAKVGNIRGIIVTIPHKEAIARLCDELGPNARMMGAVNTVRIGADSRLAGEMFDGVGLLATALANGMAPTGRRVLIVGAGGAGRAVAFALAAAGARQIGLANRTAGRAEKLAQQIAATGADARAVPADARGYDLVVNCTSLGLKQGDAMPIDPATFDSTTDLIDIIAVRDTELMQAAQAKGCRVVGGRPMIELQFEEQLRFIGPPPGFES